MDIVQQPVRARMCGLGDKDRRQISPPPFVKVSPFDITTGRPLDSTSIELSQLVLVVELWSPDETQDLTLNQNIQNVVDGDHLNNSTKHSNQPVSSDSEESMGDVPTRNLIGSTVLNAFSLLNDRHEQGIWFILGDLSVRIEGEFKLKLNLLDLSTDRSISAFSNTFKVYSAKKFPGVVDSMPLGRVFASQGVKIPIRREMRD